jgi:hypothetical protein
MKVLIIIRFISMFWGIDALAEEKGKIIYEYKKYEKFDLGNLEVKGELIAPGDISVRERERRTFRLELFTRKHFDQQSAHDMKSLR